MPKYKYPESSRKIGYRSGFGCELVVLVGVGSY